MTKQKKGYPCLRPGCNNRVKTPDTYCIDLNTQCAAVDAPRIGKRDLGYRASATPGAWGKGWFISARSVGSAIVRQVRSVGRGVSEAVQAAQVELFRMRYPTYEAFMEARRIQFPDAFAGPDHRALNNATHNLAKYYGVEFPKDLRGKGKNQARASYLQGWAMGHEDPAIAEHVRNSLSLALQQDYETVERKLEPMEFLDQLRARFNGRRS